MKYSVGEVAKIFGLTTEGVRYLEKQGIIHSERDERTGYRVFDRESVARLKSMRTYQALGFTMEEIRRMERSASQEDLLASMRAHADMISGQIAKLRAIRACLDERIALIQRFTDNPGQCELTTRPEMVFLPRIDENEFRDRPKELKSLTAVEQEWTLAMPPVTLCGRFYRADGAEATGYTRFGSIVTREAIDALGLPVCDYAIELEACPCVHAVLEGAGPRLDIGPMLAFARAQELRLCGDVYARRIADFVNADGKRQGIHEAWVPVCCATA